MNPSLIERVKRPEVRSYPYLCVQVLVEEALLGTGVFIVPFQRGNLIAEILVVNDTDVPIPLVCLRMQREGNRYWFGRIFHMDDLIATLKWLDESKRLVDEQGRDVPNTPEDRLAHFLRTQVLPHNESQKQKWAYWADHYWTAAIIAEIQRLQAQAVRAVAARR